MRGLHGSVGAATAVMATLTLADTTFAQTPSGANASAPLIAPSQRAVQAVESFRASPESLLTRHPNGGGALAAQVRDILVADKAQLERILKLLPQATAAQQEAIGSGLGLARLLYIRDTEFTNEVQTKVVALNNRNLLVGYALFGGGGVAALFGPPGPASTPATTFGPVGTVAGAPAANSQGRGGSSGGGGADNGGGGGGSGGGGSLSARSSLGANAASPSGLP